MMPRQRRGESIPSLHLTFASRLRRLSPAGELKLQGLPFSASAFDLSVSFVA
jgi:hypothetical protein